MAVVVALAVVVAAAVVVVVADVFDVVAGVVTGTEAAVENVAVVVAEIDVDTDAAVYAGEFEDATGTVVAQARNA